MGNSERNVSSRPLAIRFRPKWHFTGLSPVFFAVGELTVEIAVKRFQLLANFRQT